jgi:drug/metabolite transporter (DMT)-like permease
LRESEIVQMTAAAGVLEKERLKPIILLLFMAFLWSLNGLFIKMVDWHPLALSATRSMVATAVLLLYYRRLHITWSFTQIGGAVTYSATMIFFVVATQMTTAANAILLQYTAPVFVALLSYWFLQEKVTRFDWGTTAVVMVGMVLFFFDELAPGYLWGNILALLSGVTFACFTLFMRKQKEGSPVESVILGSILTVFIGLPFLFSGPPAGAYSWPAMIVMGLFMGIAFILYCGVIRQVRAIEAILVLIAEPLLNPLWVFIILGERPGPWALLGGMLIVGSIALRGISASRRRTPVPAAA